MMGDFLTLNRAGPTREEPTESKAEILPFVGTEVFPLPYLPLAPTEFWTCVEKTDHLPIFFQQGNPARNGKCGLVPRQPHISPGQRVHTTVQSSSYQKLRNHIPCANMFLSLIKSWKRSTHPSFLPSSLSLSLLFSFFPSLFLSTVLRLSYSGWNNQGADFNGSFPGLFLKDFGESRPEGA